MDETSLWLVLTPLPRGVFVHHPLRLLSQLPCSYLFHKVQPGIILPGGCKHRVKCCFLSIPIESRVKNKDLKIMLLGSCSCISVNRSSTRKCTLNVLLDTLLLLHRLNFARKQKFHFFVPVWALACNVERLMRH